MPIKNLVGRVKTELWVLVVLVSLFSIAEVFLGFTVLRQPTLSSTIYHGASVSIGLWLFSYFWWWLCDVAPDKVAPKIVQQAKYSCLVSAVVAVGLIVGSVVIMFT